MLRNSQCPSPQRLQAIARFRLALVFFTAGCLLGSSSALAQEPVLSATQRKLLTVFAKEFIDVKPGRDGKPAHFEMGARLATASAQERPMRKVVMHDFAIAKYEVPQNLWEAVVGANPSRWKGPRNSVEMTSFDDAVMFCEKATQMMRAAKLIEPSEVIRLPSEAEWEYAVRAGTDSIYSFGDSVAELDDYAWHTGNAAGNDPPVGAKQPNPWGLYDVHGYLWEWCADPVHENYDGAPATGGVWDDGGNARKRILRGGSWKDDATQLTSRNRRFVDRTLKDDAVGFRCVRANDQ